MQSHDHSSLTGSWDTWELAANVLFRYVVYVCILERRHATFTGTAYFDCGVVYLYKVCQVNTEGLVEQYLIASVPAKCSIQ